MVHWDMESKYRTWPPVEVSPQYILYVHIDMSSYKSPYAQPNAQVSRVSRDMLVASNIIYLPNIICSERHNIISVGRLDVSPSKRYLQ